MKKTIRNFTRHLLTFTICFTLILAAAFVSCKNESEQKPETVYYTVAFDSNGGSAVEAQQVKSGQPAVKPQNPTKTTGNTKYFGEWYTDPECQTLFDFSTPITGDTVLYAKWLSIPLGSYVVSFNSKTQTEIQDQIVKGGEKAVEPEESLVKEGYAFSHWYLTNENEAFNFTSTPITQTTTLNAKWNQSGIYAAAFEDESLFAINIYDDLEMDSQTGAW